MIDMVRWSLAWRRPDKDPPDGQPRVLKALLVARGTPCPSEIMELWTPGGGYSIGWQLVTQKPIRRWTPEAKAKVRRRNLRARLEKKLPLFADMFEKAELESRPAYYAGVDRVS